MTGTRTSRKGRPYRGLDSERRTQNRRIALIDAGLDLFGTRGYRATSVKTACDHAGLTERYFYESFANREALLGGVYDTLIADLDARLRAVVADEQTDRRARIRRLVAVFFDFMRNDERRARVMLFEVLGVGPDIDRRYQAAVRELARTLEHPALGLFPDTASRDDGRRVVSVGLVGAITQIAIQWVLEDYRTPAEEVEAKALEILWAVAASQNAAAAAVQGGG